MAAQTAPWRDPSPHNIRFVSVERDVRLEVLDWGGNGRPLVLIGCYLTAHVFDDIAPKLTEQFHVYGVTRRGLGASDRPATGYGAERSAQDLIGVLRSLSLERSILVGSSCAARDLTIVGARAVDRVGGLVYLDGAEDSTLELAEFDLPPVDTANLPPPRRPEPSPDAYRSIEAFQMAGRADAGVAFPESELRQMFAINADGSVGDALLPAWTRKAIAEDAVVRPDYAAIPVPVLALFRKVSPGAFERRYFLPASTEPQRAAVRQAYVALQVVLAKWERDLLAGVPSAKIVELPDANLFMFLSNESDVLREIRAFAASLR